MVAPVCIIGVGRRSEGSRVQPENRARFEGGVASRKGRQEEDRTCKMRGVLCVLCASPAQVLASRSGCVFLVDGDRQSRRGKRRDCRLLSANPSGSKTPAIAWKSVPSPGLPSNDPKIVHDSKGELPRAKDAKDAKKRIEPPKCLACLASLARVRLSHSPSDTAGGFDVAFCPGESFGIISLEFRRYYEGVA